MTLPEIETILNRLPHDIVVFTNNSFPQNLLLSNTYTNNNVRYAKKSISKRGWDFGRGWMVTDYDYHKCEDAINVLFTTYNSLLNNKKRRLLNAIKDFR